MNLCGFPWLEIRIAGNIIAKEKPGQTMSRKKVSQSHSLEMLSSLFGKNFLSLEEGSNL